MLPPLYKQLDSSTMQEFCHLTELLQGPPSCEGTLATASKIKPFAEDLFSVTKRLQERPDRDLVKSFYSKFPNSSLLAIIPSTSLPEGVQLSYSSSKLREALKIQSLLRIAKMAEKLPQDYSRDLWDLFKREGDTAYGKLAAQIPDYRDLAENAVVVIDAMTFGIPVLILAGPLPALITSGTAAVVSKTVRTLSHPLFLDRPDPPENLTWSCFGGVKEMEKAFEARSSGTLRSFKPSRTLGRLRVKGHIVNFNLDQRDPIDIASVEALAEHLREETFIRQNMTPEGCLAVIYALETTIIAEGSTQTTLLTEFTHGCILDLKAFCLHYLEISKQDPSLALKFRIHPNSFRGLFGGYLEELIKIGKETESKQSTLYNYALVMHDAIDKNEPLLLFDELSETKIDAFRKTVLLHIHPDRIQDPYKGHAKTLFNFYNEVFQKTIALLADGKLWLKPKS